MSEFESVATHIRITIGKKKWAKKTRKEKRCLVETALSNHDDPWIAAAVLRDLAKELLIEQVDLQTGEQKDDE